MVTALTAEASCNSAQHNETLGECNLAILKAIISALVRVVTSHKAGHVSSVSQHIPAFFVNAQIGSISKSASIQLQLFCRTPFADPLQPGPARNAYWFESQAAKHSGSTGAEFS